MCRVSNSVRGNLEFLTDDVTAAAGHVWLQLSEVSENKGETDYISNLPEIVSAARKETAGDNDNPM